MTQSAFVDMGRTRLLVADDDPILREFAVVHLSSPDVAVEVAADGAQAWERLGLGGVDLALVDLDMPVINGFELIERIRWDEALKHLPIVVVTGREDMAAVDRAFALGATSFVVKPLNWRLLLHQLAYVLRSSRAEALVRRELDKARRDADLKARILRLSQQKLIAPLDAMLDAVETIEHATKDARIQGSLTQIAKATVDLTRVHDDMAEAGRRSAS